ncbi:hypothetical protein [Frankia sp. R82]|uniref:hypothetical protein n=1 Tax=Frankia sp. R82 TaxID=2950553 RepID=UPI00204479FC|nr:hypothetical protein [Frankia sp. R82]MCM3886650.1 hypothetical protein [Frankia sp. R82]
MPRTRWAVHCRARRSDGRPCGAWAIRGGRVCRTHGGASPNARATARERLLVDDLHRAYEGERAAHEQRLRQWWIGRILAAADLLDVDPAELARNRVMVAFAERWYDAPPPPEPQMRRDGRYRIRRPGALVQPDIPGVRMRPPAAGRHLPGCSGWPAVSTGRMCLEEIRVALRPPA